MTVRDVAVIGGGVIGTALASELVRRGRHVTLIDSGSSGTTAASYGWINSHKKHPLDYHELNLAGVAAWRELAARHPFTVDFSGHIEIAEDAEHRASLAQRVERLRGLGYGARWSSASEARGAAPVSIGDDALVAVFDEGHAFPLRYIQLLREELSARNTFELRTGTVARIEVAPQTVERTVELMFEDGSSLRAREAVVCAGNGSAALVASAGGALPLVAPVIDTAAFGYLADVAAPGHGVHRMITTDTLSIRPSEDELLLVQALDLDATADPASPTPRSVAAEIQHRVAALLPHTAPRVASIRVGHRVIPADGRTAAGRIRAGSPVWAIVTHSGVVLAPWLASVIAAELCGAAPDPRLEAFQPSRFLTRAFAHAQDAPRRPGDQ